MLGKERLADGSKGLAQRELEDLGFGVLGLFDRHGEVERQRAEGGIPGHSDAYRAGHLINVEFAAVLRSAQVALVGVHRAEVPEQRGAQGFLVFDERHRKQVFHATGDQNIAAQRFGVAV